MYTPIELYKIYKTRKTLTAAQAAYLEAVKLGESAVISAAQAAVDAAWAAYANAICNDGSW